MKNTESICFYAKRDTACEFKILDDAVTVITLSVETVDVYLPQKTENKLHLIKELHDLRKYFPIHFNFWKRFSIL
ncbi:hypothetical protein DYD21_00315 [Rhodohalobacter sp. SW132]|nr:hypothetical protein DYD21_00315 [Rhodohalobacter sp. SW132]